MDSQHPIPIHLGWQPCEETIPVQSLRRRPAHLGNGGSARKCHVLNTLLSADVLCPDIRLHAQNVMPLIHRQRRRHWVECVYVLKGNDTHTSRLCVGSALPVVKIQGWRWRQHRVMPGGGGGQRAVDP